MQERLTSARIVFTRKGAWELFAALFRVTALSFIETRRCGGERLKA